LYNKKLNNNELNRYDKKIYKNHFYKHLLHSFLCTKLEKSLSEGIVHDFCNFIEFFAKLFFPRQNFPFPKYQNKIWREIYFANVGGPNFSC
jgi:hypothetical protein